MINFFCTSKAKLIALIIFPLATVFKPIVWAGGGSKAVLPAADYRQAETLLQQAGADLKDYRHLGIDRALFRDEEERHQAMQLFYKYAAENPASPQAAQAAYYAAILTEEVMRCELTLSQLFMDSGKLGLQAIEAYKRFEKRYPDFKDMDVILYRHARALCEFGDIKSIEPLVEIFVRDWPESEFSQAFDYFGARVMVEHEDYQKAMPCLDRLLEGDNGCVDQDDIRCWSARCHLQAADAAGWKPDPDTYLKRILDRTEQVALHKSRYTADATEITAAALEAMLKCTAPEEDLKGMQARRGMVKKMSTNYRGRPLAESSLEEKLEEISQRIAHHYRLLGDKVFNPDSGAPQRTAFMHYNRALIEYPQSPEADYLHFCKGLCLVSMGRCNEGVSELRKVIEEYQESQYLEETRFRLAFTLGGVMKHYTQAARGMEETAQLYPGGKWAAEALFHAGLYYQFMDDYDNAIRCFSYLARTYRSSPRAFWAADLAGKLAAEKNNALNVKKGENNAKK